MWKHHWSLRMKKERKEELRFSYFILTKKYNDLKKKISLKTRLFINDMIFVIICAVKLAVRPCDLNANGICDADYGLDVAGARRRGAAQRRLACRRCDGRVGGHENFVVIIRSKRSASESSGVPGRRGRSDWRGGRDFRWRRMLLRNWNRRQRLGRSTRKIGE